MPVALRGVKGSLQPVQPVAAMFRRRNLGGLFHDVVEVDLRVKPRTTRRSGLRAERCEADVLRQNKQRIKDTFASKVPTRLGDEARSEPDRLNSFAYNIDGWSHVVDVVKQQADVLVRRKP